MMLKACGTSFVQAIVSQGLYATHKYKKHFHAYYLTIHGFKSTNKIITLNKLINNL